MEFRILLGVLLVSFLSTTLVMFPASADDLLRTDFQEESFAKVVDFFDYARAWAVLHGLPRPQNHWHAYAYLTYVNKSGLQMLYAGLQNISLANQAFLTIPMQTVLLHYKTENNSRDAIVASSFLMLMGFNDTADSIHPHSPDRNDTLWASFSFGVNLQQFFPNADLPAFSSTSEVFPLTSSEDGLTWRWGMRYINLTALWITTRISEENETDTSRPWGLVTYDELTFNYTLSIDPDEGKATLTQDHVIGRMRDLWTFWGWFIVPLYNRYNSTGCYRYGAKVSDETIYGFLEANNVKMSIIAYQTSITLDGSTYSMSTAGQNVTDSEVLVSDSSVSTYTDEGEKIIDTDFKVKETYKLFNYREDETETEFDTHDAVTRTQQIGGYARNRDLFSFHRNFGKYLPLILVHMYPNLYQRAKETVANMTRADYLYAISYPSYSGYRVEHDPLHAIYFAVPATPAAVPSPNWGGLIVLGILGGLVVGVVVAAVALIIGRRRPKQPQPPPPPSAV